MAESIRPAGPLDEAVFPAWKAIEELLPRPDALLLLGTGMGVLPATLARLERLPMQNIAGVPAAWRQGELVAGERDGLLIWALVDAPGPIDFGEALTADEAPWVRGFPCWLARAAGAEVLLHTSAGTGLARHGAEPGARGGTLALVADHINLSGTTPLRGLGPTRLGPLFPDTSALHDPVLRKAALEIARARGIAVVEGVVACTLAPALDTQAERIYFARAGAAFAVQGLAGPLLAAAHAGLALLGIAALTDEGDAALDLRKILARADALAPALEELVAALCGPIAQRVAELREAR